jgi:uncharacterized membrane-anchored protein
VGNIQANMENNEYKKGNIIAQVIAELSSIKAPSPAIQKLLERISEESVKWYPGFTKSSSTQPEHGLLARFKRLTTT